MLLTIDVGNTQTVIGLYENGALTCTWRIVTHKFETSDELRIKSLSLLTTINVEPVSIHGCIIASVVPTLTRAWTLCLRELTNTDPLICNAETAQGLFKTHYSNPSEIGADRVADSVAARALYGAPVVVVDFGTATNLEVIDKDGYFIGGVIAPGLETSAQALFMHATKLPTIDLVDPGSVIGTDTIHAMQAGIVYGEADRVNGFVRRIFDELGYEAPVVATGGLATTMAPLCSSITITNPDLTLEGLRLIYDIHHNEK